MAEKIQATPPSVSSNDAIMEMLKSMRSEISDSARKADERFQRTEDRVFEKDRPEFKTGFHFGEGEISRTRLLKKCAMNQPVWVLGIVLLRLTKMNLSQRPAKTLGTSE